MKCCECGTESAEKVEVEFFNGSITEIQLCPECADDYRDGASVDSVDSA